MIHIPNISQTFVCSACLRYDDILPMMPLWPHTQLHVYVLVMALMVHTLTCTYRSWTTINRIYTNKKQTNKPNKKTNKNQKPKNPINKNKTKKWRRHKKWNIAPNLTLGNKVFRLKKFKSKEQNNFIFLLNMNVKQKNLELYYSICQIDAVYWEACTITCNFMMAQC